MRKFMRRRNAMRNTPPNPEPSDSESSRRREQYSLDLPERPRPVTGALVTQSTSDTELHRIKKDSGTPVRTNSVNEIGRLFRRNTGTSTNSILQNDAVEGEDDPVVRVRHLNVEPHRPSLVIPSEFPQQGIRPQVYGVSLSEVSPTQPTAPPPTPSLIHNDNLEAENNIGFIGNVSVQQSGGHSGGIPADFLRVDIPSSELSPPAETYQVSWGRL
ncbi:hypothetical protein C8Q75DRAFT_739713 [Abortiporus biennis]|nr:hypothetical protein C8Q75DRAFT_739713 [Abortiporus biennis]